MERLLTHGSGWRAPERSEPAVQKNNLRLHMTGSLFGLCSPAPSIKLFLGFFFRHYWLAY